MSLQPTRPPSEYQQSLDAIARRRAIAEAMMQGAMQTRGTEMSGTGRHPIAVAQSPWEAIAKVGSAYLANKQLGKLDDERGEIAKAMASDRTKALEGLIPQDMAPSYEPDPMADESQGPTRMTPVARPGRPNPASIQAAIDAGVDPAAIAAATRQPTQVNLGRGEKRIDETGRVIATGDPLPDYEPQKIAAAAAAAAETARHNKATETTAATAAQAKASPVNPLTPEGMDLAAQEYLASGKLPPGLGRAAAGINAKIVSRAAELASANGDDAKAATLHRAAFGAAKGALNKLTQQRTMVGSFERTALKNLEIALEESKKVDRTGSPIINRWLLAGKKNIGGDVAVGRFHTALTSALNEYAKVLSGATGAAGISDAARKEAESLLSTADTPEAVAGIADIMKREMANREAGFAEQEAQLHETMSGSKAIPVGDAEPGAPTAPGAARQAPATNAKGWKLHVDAHGNKAYVGPNNEVEEVQ